MLLTNTKRILHSKTVGGICTKRICYTCQRYAGNTRSSIACLTYMSRQPGNLNM